ncbi:MAG: DUF6252 family protein [Flavobacterium sp.]
MKNIKLIFATILSLIIISCENEPVDPVLISQNINNDVFTANINGVAFSDATISVLQTSINGVNFISIGGARSNDNITINVKETLGIGSYNITGANTDQVQAKYIITNPSYNQTATLGIISITEKTATRIKGTFNFTTPNTPTPYIFTSGSFDVEL